MESVRNLASMHCYQYYLLFVLKQCPEAVASPLTEVLYVRIVIGGLVLELLQFKQYSALQLA